MNNPTLKHFHDILTEAFYSLNYVLKVRMLQENLDIDALTSHYLYHLSPITYSKKKKRNIPVYEAYADLMELLDIDDDRMHEYKKKILGNSCIVTAPAEYYDISMALEYRIPYHIWINPNEFPVDAKAKLRATVWLKGMAEVLDSHIREQESNQKGVSNGG